jgi:hypothetical protein
VGVSRVQGTLTNQDDDYAKRYSVKGARVGGRLKTRGATGSQAPECREVEAISIEPNDAMRLASGNALSYTGLDPKGKARARYTSVCDLVSSFSFGRGQVHPIVRMKLLSFYLLTLQLIGRRLLAPAFAVVLRVRRGQKEVRHGRGSAEASTCAGTGANGLPLIHSICCSGTPRWLHILENATRSSVAVLAPRITHLRASP